MLNFVVEQSDRLDKFLATQVRVSRGRVQRAIKDGLVLVNERQILEPDFKINLGDKISLPEFADESLQPLEYDLKIVYENDDILVIDKPSNLVVHPGAGHKQDTLSNVLIGKYPGVAQVGDPTRPGIVHRLDEDTSGLIVAAKTQTGYDYMKNLFLTRDIKKQYITLVHGIPEKLHEVINEPIGRSGTHVKMKVGIGREAVTEYSVLATNEEYLKGHPHQTTSVEHPLDQMALIKVKLHTGRTHQIRVHMAHIGHPVVGDQLYGGSFKSTDSHLINRQFLHAARLQFKLADGTDLELESPLPVELQEVLVKVGIPNINIQ